MLKSTDDIHLKVMLPSSEHISMSLVGKNPGVELRTMPHPVWQVAHLSSIDFAQYCTSVDDVKLLNGGSKGTQALDLTSRTNSWCSARYQINGVYLDV